MIAKVVQGDIDPRRIDEAAAAVQEELIPLFLAHDGAVQGYWMADRSSGRVVVMTSWADRRCLEAARAADGQERTGVAERLGLRVVAIDTMDVLGAYEAPHETQSAHTWRWARVTWVEGVSPSLDQSLRQMYRDLLPAERRSVGHCGTYWFADLRAGAGLGLSLWSDHRDGRASEPESRQKRKWFEATVGCRIDHVGEYEALGVTGAATIDLHDHAAVSAT